MPSAAIAILRLRALLNELEKIGQSDFPYSDSKEALECIRSLISADLELLEGFTDASDKDVVAQQIAVSLRHARIYLPILGFILRSTNVRNAFEVYGPLRRLARTIHPTAKLVISSEWQESPFVYTHVEAFPEFALIGLPATESSNALLIPLAGHEFGHVIWSRERLNERFKARARKKALEVVASQREDLRIAYPELAAVTGDFENNLHALYAWSQLQQLAIAQLEEAYCDLVGTRIFGTAYLQAFDYLLCGYADSVSIRYPSLRARAGLIYDAAMSFNIDVEWAYPSREDFITKFQAVDAQDKTAEPVKRRALETIFVDLCQGLDVAVDDTITKAGIMLPDENDVHRIKRQFERQVPASGCRGLPEIINGGWRAMLDPELWSRAPFLRDRRHFVVNELILKTIEVLDVEQILTGYNAASS